MSSKQEVLDQIKELKIKISELEATVNKPDVAFQLVKDLNSGRVVL